MMSEQKLRIKLRGYDHNIVDRAAKDIVVFAERTGAVIKGPVPLPNKKKILTVNRSPHVNKKSRELFLMEESVRLVIVYPTPQTIDSLMKLELAAGVDVEIKLVEVRA